VLVLLLLAIGAVLWWIRRDRSQKAIVLNQIAMNELGHNGAAIGMIDNPMAGRAAAAAAAATGGGVNADPPPEVPLVVNPMYAPGGDGGALSTEVPLIANIYAGGGGPLAPATTTPVDDTYSGYAPPETAFRMAPTANATAAAANQSNPIIYAVPAEEGNTLVQAANNHTADSASASSTTTTTTTAVAIVAGTVVYDPSGGGEAEYVARDDMVGGGGAGNVNYEVVDGEGSAAAAAPRPAVVGAGAVVVGARSQLQSSTTTHEYTKLCTRPSPTGGTCKNIALPGGGGLFCKGHTCPECDVGKSSSAVGCPAHSTAAPAGSSNSTIVYAVPADDGPDDGGADGGGANDAGVYYDADAVPGEATIPANNGVYYDADAVPAEGGGETHAVAAAAVPAQSTLTMESTTMLPI
jgi:hypothetical protein